MFQTANEAIEFSLTKSQSLLHRMVDDLKPDEFERQPCLGGNCAAWILGHLVLTDRRVLAMLGRPVPDLPAGFEEMFQTTRKSAESQSGYGDPKVLISEFDRHRQLLIEAIRQATPQQLATPLQNPHPLFGTVGEAAMFMGLHVMMHVGQISTIRRMLGYPPVA